MDFKFFREFLSIDSTSGEEREVALWLAERLVGMFPASNRPALRVDEVGDGTINLLLTWGEPRIVFCSHIDTVPPYIPPTFPKELTSLTSGPAVQTDGRSQPAMTCGAHTAPASDVRPGLTSDIQPGLTSNVIPGLTGNLPEVIAGRGSCDAKGQVFAIVEACKRLAEEGKTDFGMLLLSGEETGSWGAKAFAKTDFKAEYLVVGEPTDNCMVSASKGTKSFDLKFTGEPFHSGYPQYGVSAVDLFVDFVNQLKAKDFGIDPVLGETTWNIGLLHSDNPQNILSPELTCRIYFRTTFVSDEAVCKWMNELNRAEDGAVSGAFARIGSRSDAEETAPSSVPSSVPTSVLSSVPQSAPSSASPSASITVTPRGGDTPARYWTVEGLPAKSVAFGSDAPHLTNFTHKAICGPGSITVAHRDDEHVLVADLATAVEQYLVLYRSVME